MRHFVAVLVCALVVLGIAREAAQAQSPTPATAPNFEAEPFSSSKLLRGKRITQAECAALPGCVGGRRPAGRVHPLLSRDGRWLRA
jgi:hypothetical protein